MDYIQANTATGAIDPSIILSVPDDCPPTDNADYVQPAHGWAWLDTQVPAVAAAIEVYVSAQAEATAVHEDVG